MNILYNTLFAGLANVAVLTETAGFDFVKVLIVSLVIGLICGLIRALSLKGQLTSVYKKSSASDYKRPNSFKVTKERDIFLGSKTETTAKPQQQQNASK